LRGIIVLTIQALIDGIPGPKRSTGVRYFRRVTQTSAINVLLDSESWDSAAGCQRDVGIDTELCKHKLPIQNCKGPLRDGTVRQAIMPRDLQTIQARGVPSWVCKDTTV
jgi:hypothetical protein